MINWYHFENNHMFFFDILFTYLKNSQFTKKKSTKQDWWFSNIWYAKEFEYHELYYSVNEWCNICIRYLIDMRFYFKDLAAKRCFELMVIVNPFLSLRRCCLKLFLNERSRQDAMNKKSLWDEILKWLSS